MPYSYIRFDFQTKNLKLAEPYIRIYPLVCFHLGSHQADVKFIREHLKRVEKDPNARWIYMGDGGECVTKYSKGDVYGQLLNPQAQMEMLCDLLSPIKHKGLFGVRGNHGKRIYKETGLDFDQNLLTRLGLPYLGISAMCNLVVNKSSYDVYVHHGIDSGIALNAKISKAEQFTKFINADAIFTAHSHVCIDLQPSALIQADNTWRKVGTRMRHQYICGSAYDSRGGYAEDKGYPPLIPSHLAVAFDGRVIQGFPQKTQAVSKWSSDGQYELVHDYLDKYLLGGNANG